MKICRFITKNKDVLINLDYVMYCMKYKGHLEVTLCGDKKVIISSEDVQDFISQWVAYEK